MCLNEGFKEEKYLNFENRYYEPWNVTSILNFHFINILKMYTFYFSIQVQLFFPILKKKKFSIIQYYECVLSSLNGVLAKLKKKVKAFNK